MVKESLYSAGLLTLISGTCVGAPLAQLARRERPDPLILIFILVSHFFVIPVVRHAVRGDWNDLNDRMILLTAILGYLAGVGCGVWLIVT
jgi:hypothetical protein